MFDLTQFSTRKKSNVALNISYSLWHNSHDEAKFVKFADSRAWTLILARCGQDPPAVVLGYADVGESLLALFRDVWQCARLIAPSHIYTAKPVDAALTALQIRRSHSFKDDLKQPIRRQSEYCRHFCRKRIFLGIQDCLETLDSVGCSYSTGVPNEIRVMS